MRSKNSMNEDHERVIDWLLCASSQIAPDYMRLPVAGREEPQYRERVYCYELYHRWRCHWPSGFRYSLCGEIDKTGHPIIRGEPKPDFLVHVPRHMENLLAMEVKSKTNATNNVAGMVEDIIKLTTFRRDLGEKSQNYFAAIFWLYGVSDRDWPEMRGRLRQQVVEKPNDIDLSLISCFIHAESGCRAHKVDWE